MCSTGLTKEAAQIGRAASWVHGALSLAPTRRSCQAAKIDSLWAAFTELASNRPTGHVLPDAQARERPVAANRQDDAACALRQRPPDLSILPAGAERGPASPDRRRQG